ncbi:MAG: hypothetical protein K6G31_10915 [Paludibacteraceae bacterium]|nr:hypothetical protein [Paludibacteraceae bacterium]MCR5569772.1 hypothetical protein [Paludibacteraceae bacterium]
MGQETPEKKNENSFSSLLYNIVLPVTCLFTLPKLLLKMLEISEKDASKIGLVIALAFPIVYFIYLFIKERKTSFLAIVGFLGILVTGIIGIMELPREYVAYERAAIPLLFAIAVIITNYTKTPLIKKIFYNPKMFNTEKIDALISEHHTEEDFKGTLKNTSFMIAGSFVLSSICNYLITNHYMSDLSLTYNEALAKVKLMSIAITIIPLLIIMIGAVFYFQNQLKKHTKVENIEELYSEEMKES